MAAVVNDRDLQLEATSPRVANVSIAPNIVVDSSNVTGLGLVIDSAKSVVLSATSQIFSVPSSGATAPASITVAATVNNISATPTLTIVSGSGTMSVVPALTGGTFTFSPAQMTSDNLSLILSVTEAGITYTDTVSFAKLHEGSSTVNVLMTNESSIVSADYLGNVLTFTTAKGQLRVYQGVADVTSVCTFSVASGDNPYGLTYTLQAGPGNLGGTYAFTGMPTNGPDKATMTFTVTFGSNTYRPTFTIQKSKQVSPAASSYTLVPLNNNTVASGSVGSKVAGGGAWNGYVYSLQAFTGGARAGFTPTVLGDYFVGLDSTPASVANYTDIDFGLNVGINGTVNVYQSGSLTNPGVSWVLGDTFAVTYTGTSVYFSKNSVVFLTLTTTASQTLYLIGAFYQPGNSASFIYASASANGTPGNTGQTGARGSQTFYVALSGSTATYSDSLATSTASSGGGPILNDLVVQYNSSQGFSQSKFWTGSAWAIVNAVVDGNLLVSGTVGTNALAANSVTAGKIDARGLNIEDASGNIIFGSGVDLDYTRLANAPQSTGSLLIRGSFEDGLMGYWQGTTIAAVSGQVFTEAIACTGRDTLEVSNSIPVNGAETIWMSASLFPNSASGAGFGVFVYDKSNNISFIQGIYVPPNASPAWVTSTASVVLPSSAVRMVPWIQNNNSAGGSGLPYIYAAQLYLGRSQPGSTVGAAFGVNIAGQITSGNASTYIAAAAIGSAQVGTINANQVNAANLSAITATIGQLQTATTGGRMVIKDNKLAVYDTNNVIRVRLGDLSGTF